VRPFFQVYNRNRIVFSYFHGAGRPHQAGCRRRIEMALKAVLDKLDGLSDEFRKLYVERDGKFYLDVEAVDGWNLEDVRELKSALSSEREARKKAEGKVGAFGELDPEKAKEAIQKLEEMKDWTPDEKVKEQIEVQVAAIKEKLQGEIDGHIKTVEDLNSQLSTHIIDNSALAALAKHKGNSKLLLPHVRQMVKAVKDENGRLIAQVVDEKGGPRISMKQGSTDPMEIEELVEWMKNQSDFAPGFEGNGASGSGAKGGSQGDGGGNPPPPADLSPTARLARAHKEARTT